MISFRNYVDYVDDLALLANTPTQAKYISYIYIYTYEVHTISFQTFFLWAFTIVVDS